MDRFDKGSRLLESADAAEQARGFALIREVAETESRTAALHAVGHCYLYGVGVERDPAEAFRWFTRAAGQGCPQGMYHLGVCNENGYGTPVDPEKAAYWFRQSAERGGDEDAMYRLGRCCETGAGVPKDMAAAKAWYTEAAARGQDEAQEALQRLER